MSKLSVPKNTNPNPSGPASGPLRAGVAVSRQNTVNPARRTVYGGLALWILFSLLQAAVLRVQEGLAYPYALVDSLVNYGLLGILTWPLWLVLKRFGSRQRPIWQRILLHLACLLAVVPLWQFLYSYCFITLVLGPETLEIMQSSGGLWLIVQKILTYTLLTVAIVAVQSSRRLTRERRQSAELEILRREAEVRALRAQIRPHFLFNSLNSIYSLIQTEPQGAETMVLLLSDLMRETLEVSDQKTVTLETELALVRRYLEIESVRLGDRLTIAIEAEPDVLKAQVPPFLLQPVVENSVQHGIAPSHVGGTLRVSAERQRNVRGSELKVTVQDNGVGLSKHHQEGNGLRITRARLQNLYGESSQLLLIAREPAGVEVSLHLPLDLAAPDPDLDLEAGSLMSEVSAPQKQPLLP